MRTAAPRRRAALAVRLYSSTCENEVRAIAPLSEGGYTMKARGKNAVVPAPCVSAGLAGSLRVNIANALTGGIAARAIPRRVKDEGTRAAQNGVAKGAFGYGVYGRGT